MFQALTNEDMDTAWARALSQVTELCEGQANRAWFVLRKFAYTSSTALAAVNAHFPALYQGAESKSDCERVAQYLNVKADKVISGDSFESKLDDKSDPLKDIDSFSSEYFESKTAGDINVIFSAANKVLKKGSKMKTEDTKRASKIAAILAHVDQVKAQLECTGDIEDMSNALLKTWFMKEIKGSTRVALGIGQANEAPVRAHLGTFLPSSDVLVIETREFGLHANKERPYICGSVDGISMIYDRQTGRLEPVINEIKTKTTTNLIHDQDTASSYRRISDEGQPAGLCCQMSAISDHLFSNVL